MTASMGLPDLGVITVDEVCFFIRQVARASGLPLLADGDTGYGEALNVMHMVRAFEDAGAGAVHIEDQILPKKCGHLNNKKLADPHDMAAKVAAAARARRHLFIIARTDAAASEGIDGAVARAKRYLDAGADAIFPEALVNADMFRAFAKAMPGVPLLANMTEFGQTPFFTAAEFEAMGYKIVIWPVSSLRVANKSQARLYAASARWRHAEHAGRHADPSRALPNDRLPRLRGARFVDRRDHRAAGHAAALGGGPHGWGARHASGASFHAHLFREGPARSWVCGTLAVRKTMTRHWKVARPQLKPERREIRRAAVEVGRVLEGLAEPEHVAFGVGLADDLDADRHPADWPDGMARPHRPNSWPAASGSPGSARSRRPRRGESPVSP